MNKKNALLVLRWSVWSLAILFLFYEFFLRVFPSVMVDDLTRDFKVDDAIVGTLSAFYFYSYAPMQIPVGVLMDRYGARRLLTLASLVCGLGCFFFAFAHVIYVAEFGRLLMGVGSALAFVGMVYVSSHWFPPEKLGMLVGLGNSIGMLGAAGGEGPLSLVVNAFGWRETVFLLGVIGIAIAIIIFLFIRKEPPHVHKKAAPKTSFDEVWENLKDVCRNKSTWINSIAALLFYLTTGTFAGLWAVPFLEKVHGIPRSEAAFITSMIFIGWIVGGPIIGYASDYFNKRRPSLIFCCLMLALLLVPTIYVQEIPTWVFFILFFGIGFFSAGELLNFSLAIEINERKAKGTAVSLTNCFVALGGALMQPLVGYLIDISSKHISGAAIGYEYRISFVVFPVSAVLAAFLSSFVSKHAKK